jgi:integrase
VHRTRPQRLSPSLAHRCGVLGRSGSTTPGFGGAPIGGSSNLGADGTVSRRRTRLVSLAEAASAGRTSQQVLELVTKAAVTLAGAATVHIWLVRSGGRELRQLTDVARAEFPLEIYVLVLTLARTGLRPGEGRCLQIADVDLAVRQLWVRRTEGPRGRKHGIARFNAPKSHQVRRVDMSDQLVADIEAYLGIRQRGSPRARGCSRPHPRAGSQPTRNERRQAEISGFRPTPVPPGGTDPKNPSATRRSRSSGSDSCRGPVSDTENRTG